MVSLLGSWIPSIWADEGASVSAAKRSFSQLWLLVGNIDAVHAAYYFVLNAWFRLVPADAFWLRLPSAVAVGLATVLVLRIARRWLDASTSVLAAFFFAVVPRTTWMGSEGRSSAFSTLLALAATWALVRALGRSTQWVFWVAYAGFLGLGIAMHIYLVFLIPAHGVTLLFLRRERGVWIRWLGSAAVGAALAAPVALAASGQTAQINGPAISVTDWVVDFALNQAFLGQTPGPVGDPWFRFAWQAGAIGLTLVGWALVAVATLAAWRSVAGPERTKLRELLGWAVPWAVLPSVLVLVWSMGPRNMYHPRYFAFCVPAIALLMAAGVRRLTPAVLRPLVIVLVAALALPVYVSQRGVNAKGGSDWSQLAAQVAGQARPGDGVYYCPDPNARRLAIAYPDPFDALIDLTLIRSAPDDGSLGGASAPLAESLAARNTPRAVWTLCRSDGPNRAGDDATFVAAGYVRESTWEGSQTELVQYRKP